MGGAYYFGIFLQLRCCAAVSRALTKQSAFVSIFSLKSEITLRQVGRLDISSLKFRSAVEKKKVSLHACGLSR